MVRDILLVESGFDLGLAVSSIPKAANVLSVQQGELEYAPDFGVDKKYFLSAPMLFQNDSFKAYLIQRLTEHQIQVARVLDTVHAFFRKFTFEIAEVPASADFTETEIINNVLTDADGAYLTDADGGVLTDVF